MKYEAPKRESRGFTCPHCGVYSEQRWWYNAAQLGDGRHSDSSTNPIALSRCTHCLQACLWWQQTMVHPSRGSAPPPNPDLPALVKAIYEEAAAVSGLSSRGAAALLRLAIQHLAAQLGGKGDNINEDIRLLVQRGLPVTIQQALDVVRVIGNNAVHPGQIDTDDPKVVGELFVLINLIADYMISMPGRVSGLFSELPPSALAAIQNATENLKFSMSIHELETAVRQLPREEFAQFQAWFEEFAADAWDAQIEADARAGKLDHLINQADADFEAGALHTAVRHFAAPAFWFHYRQLPAAVQVLADKNFVLLRSDPHHASLRFRPVAGALWSARVGLHYRALARQRAEGFVWVWVGHHSVYDQILRSPPK